MDTPPFDPWASRLAKVCVCAIFFLIFIGAIVTTAGAGMAAPNAPHVDGALLHPQSPVTNTVWWKDPALFKEHTHRLAAMFTGLCVGALAAKVWRNWPAFLGAVGMMGIGGALQSVFKFDPVMAAHLRVWPAMLVFLVWLIITARKRGEKPGAIQWMVFIAFVCTCVQAVVGVLRVEVETAGHLALATNIRTIHGIFAQAFLALLVVIAARLSPIWQSLGSRAPHPAAAKIRSMAVSLLILYFLQLACAAYIRHRGLGLLISSWPMAEPGGGLWPSAWAVGDGALRHKLMIHFLHTRILPILILGHVIGLAIAIAKRAAGEIRLTRLGWTLLALVALQIILGVMVIWKGRHPHITNTHVIVGACICAATALLMTRAGRLRTAV